MNTEELSNRLIQILTGITSGEPNPNIIQGFVKNFIEDFKPDYYYEISVTDVEGYTPKAYIFSYTISIPVLYPIAKRINPQTKNPYMNQNI